MKRYPSSASIRRLQRTWAASLLCVILVPWIVMILAGMAFSDDCARDWRRAED